MLAKIFWNLAACIVIAVTPVLILYGLSDQKNKVKNGFDRQFIKSPVQLNSVAFNLGSEDFYISGVTADHVFLADKSNPGRLFHCSLALSDTQAVILQAKTNDVRDLMIKTDSPFVWLLNGISRQIDCFTLIGKQAFRLRSFKKDSLHFDLAVPVSATAVIVRSADSIKNFLAKKGEDGASKVSKVLEKQIDGIFCTDGLLATNKNGSVVYVYFYRNEFLLLDTNLNSLSKHRTIDTNTVAKFSIAYTPDRKFASMSSPTGPNNVKLLVTGKNILVRSSLRADGESKLLFGKSSVIDVYDITSGKYQYSFYIGDLDHMKVRDFQLLDPKTLVTLQGNYLLLYHLDFSVP